MVGIINVIMMVPVLDCIQSAFTEIQPANSCQDVY